jgi:hypothetical protein
MYHSEHVLFFLKVISLYAVLKQRDAISKNMNIFSLLFRSAWLFLFEYPNVYFPFTLLSFQNYNQSFSDTALLKNIEHFQKFITQYLVSYKHLICTKLQSYV